MTYFTAMVDEKGRIATFSDIYGHDNRLPAALMGRALKYESVIETSSADMSGDEYLGRDQRAAAEGQEGDEAELLGTRVDCRRQISDFLGT